jgi:SAM-dependent methyltransferase
MRKCSGAIFGASMLFQDGWNSMSKNFNDIFIEKFLKEEFSHINGSENSLFLDLGCGERPYQKFYNKYFKKTISTDYVATKNTDICADAQSLPFEDNIFDYILMTEVIEHIPDENKAIAEIYRVLKPGGILFLTWPFNYMMHEIPNDHARYTEFGMSNRVERVGLKIDYILRRGNAFVLLLTIVDFLIKGFLEFGARLPILGRFFNFLKQNLFPFLYNTIYYAYLAVTWHRKHTSKCSVGGFLNGPIGHASLWTLGYCALVRKLSD